MTDQGDTLRAAQIQAVREALDFAEYGREDNETLAGQLVDVVLAVGRVAEGPVDELADYVPTARPTAADRQLVTNATGGRIASREVQPEWADDEHGQGDTPLDRVRKGLVDAIRPHMAALGREASHALEALGEDADGDYLTPAEHRDLIAQAEARGYAAAVANLRDDQGYRDWRWPGEAPWALPGNKRIPSTFSERTARHHAADYLEAVGPRKDQKRTEEEQVGG